MLYDRGHLYVVPDPPPLEVDERLRDEVATAQKIQRLLVWGALLAGVLAFCGCSKAEAEPLPEFAAAPAAAVLAQALADCDATGTRVPPSAREERGFLYVRCDARPLPDLGKWRVRR